MALKDIIGPYALVFKENSPDVQTSRRWYVDKLGLQHDPRYDVPPNTGEIWSQLNVPEIENVAVGLSNGKVGAGSSVLTFVVPNIEYARNQLLANNIKVDPIKDVGLGVLLAFFKDDVDNPLCLRQNPKGQPQEFF